MQVLSSVNSSVNQEVKWHNSSTIPVKFRSVVVGDLKGRRRSKKKARFANLRLSSIEKLIKGRHGGPCDTDDAEIYLEAALPYLVDQANYYGRPVSSLAWAQQWTPALVEDRGHSWFNEAETEAAMHPKYLSSDQLAKLLQVTSDEVRRYGLNTLGSVDRPKKQRKQDRKAKDREYQRQKRLDAGATPRDQSLTTQKPWEIAGVSRATWYRRNRAT
jgi:hypothetical protein